MPKNDKALLQIGIVPVFAMGTAERHTGSVIEVTMEGAVIKCLFFLVKS